MLLDYSLGFPNKGAFVSYNYVLKSRRGIKEHLLSFSNYFKKYSKEGKICMQSKLLPESQKNQIWNPTDQCLQTE